MPLFKYDHVEPFLLTGLKSVLQKTTDFEAFEAQASIIIRDRAGIVIPEVAPSEAAPDWIPRIAAALVNKLASVRLSASSKDLLDAVERDYRDALAFLDGTTARADAASSVSVASFGTVEGRDSW